jgi:hypothetical protein
MRSWPLARRHRRGQQRVNIELSIFFFIPDKFILNINQIHLLPLLEAWS